MAIDCVEILISYFSVELQYDSLLKSAKAIPNS